MAIKLNLLICIFHFCWLPKNLIVFCLSVCAVVTFNGNAWFNKLQFKIKPIWFFEEATKKKERKEKGEGSFLFLAWSPDIFVPPCGNQALYSVPSPRRSRIYINCLISLSSFSIKTLFLPFLYSQNWMLEIYYSYTCLNWRYKSSCFCALLQIEQLLQWYVYLLLQETLYLNRVKSDCVDLYLPHTE